MGRKIAEMRVVCTKEELQEAMRQSRQDEAALLFFLGLASSEDITLRGHSAKDALAAARRLLRITDEHFDRLLTVLAP
jgi:hypothetical protein